MPELTAIGLPNRVGPLAGLRTTERVQIPARAYPLGLLQYRFYCRAGVLCRGGVASGHAQRAQRHCR